MDAKFIVQRLERLSDAQNAEHAQRFFKTGPGQYGEGDVFLGIRVPVLRKIAGEVFKQLDLSQIEYLLRSPYHEVRHLALLVLNKQFVKADEQTRQRIVTCYLEQSQFINNWDLVDCSAHLILGPWLENREQAIL